MPFGSVLANAREVTLSTADNKSVTLKGFFPRLGLRLIGIPHFGLRVRASTILPLMNIKQNDVVLDAGCGTGIYSFTMAFNGATVYGVDINKKKIKQCKSLSEQMDMGNRVYFFKASILKLPFPDKFFDKILFSETLEHIYPCRKALKELNRVLKPGGRLIISVPTDIFINQWYAEEFGHYRLYTLDLLMKQLPSNLDITAVIKKNKTLGQLLWLINRKMFSNKVMTAIFFLPLYCLTLFDWVGPGRELIVRVRKNV